MDLETLIYESLLTSQNEQRSRVNNPILYIAKGLFLLYLLQILTMVNCETLTVCIKYTDHLSKFVDISFSNENATLAAAAFLSSMSVNDESKVEELTGRMLNPSSSSSEIRLYSPGQTSILDTLKPLLLPDTTFLQAGAHHFFPPVRDPTIYDLTSKKNIRGVLVEASPSVYFELQSRKNKDINGYLYHTLQGAACDVDGSQTFYTSKKLTSTNNCVELSTGEEVCTNYHPEKESELGSMRREVIGRTLLGDEVNSDESRDALIEEVNVRCYSPSGILEAVNSLFEFDFGVKGEVGYPFDFVVTDTEGFDFVILKSMLVDGWRPRVILTEIGHLPDVCLMHEMLSGLGYELLTHGDDGLWVMK